ncbi:ABC transporter permease [Haloferax denitrificans]|uniref:Binding-protein-dependent transport systems inner membrane component n=1 Tax=Haloferax denitrificans ATCC 35960 TaxID=662478 RepID=M0JD55_9EURY|nr:ABC transporter permease [Haloferax denitrificans]EMA06911.1 binding-protein-dependent transport systems inner membrane component [Haloferax denitrificans ATCC 35960]
MGALIEGWQYLLTNFGEFLTLLQEHLFMVAVAELAAIAVAVPAAIVATRSDRAKKWILNVGNVAQTIPTLAIIALVYPLLGIGLKSAIFGIWVYALLPILTNTVTGIENVDRETVNAARGMGMTDWEIMKRIQLPLAIPVIFAGIRTSSVINVGTAYLAFFIGGGGLGLWVISGIQLFNTPQMLAGAIPGALLAICADLLLAGVERYVGRGHDVQVGVSA